MIIYGRVYKITNLINNKVYIGQTTQDPKERFRAHCRKNGCIAIHSAIKKYGKSNFKIETIALAANPEELNIKETYWIYFYNSTSRKHGYNLCFGGADRRVIQETKDRMSKSAKKKVLTQETKDKISKALRGRVFKEGHGKKISEAKAGLKYNWKNKCMWSKLPKEQYEKRVMSLRVKHKTKEDSRRAMNANLKKRRQFFNSEFKKRGKLEGIVCESTGEFFKSYNAAARKYNINACSLREHVIGLYSHAGGYVFKPIFSENEEKEIVNV